jgi:hypothetical protein
MVNGWVSWVGSIDKAILTVLEEQAENLVKAISEWKKYSHQWHGWVSSSTTQSVSGSIMGVGPTTGLSAVS